MSHPTFPLFSITGSPEEAAAQTAQALLPLARELVAFRQGLLRSLFHGRLPSVEAARMASIVASHETHTPYAARESKALAEALGLSAGDALVLSGLSDWLDFLQATSTDDLGCSALLLPPQHHRDTPCLQTWDLHLAIERYAVLLRRTITGLLPSLTLTTALGHAHFGVNSQGVCVGTNNLQCRHPQEGVVFSAAIAHILDHATTADEGVDLLRQLPLMSGHNYLLADPSGATFNVEQSTRGLCATPITNTPLAHTNHYLAPALVPHGLHYSPTSEPRRRMLQDASASLSPGAPNLEEWRRLLSDHTAPVCRHATDDHEAATCGAVAFHPQQRALSILRGRPCKGTWATYTVAP